MAAFEAEKKYKKNLDALKVELQEKIREIEGLKKEVKDLHDKQGRLDGERKKLETALINKNQKPPKETNNESLAFSQAQELMQIKD